MSASLPLKNKTVLITRPQGLADALIQRINAAGGLAQHYPVIRICDVEESESLNSIINNLSDFDLAIFISPTAVQKTLSKIKSLPDQLALAVIGRSTEAMLNKFGYQADVVPEDFNTESLLQHPALQPINIADKSIVIFRGVGGLELLGDTLVQRGAKVTYAETYLRKKNQLDSLSLDQLAEIDALSVSSNEGLQNLFDLTDDASKTSLTALPIIVPGGRAHKLANQLGFNTVIQAENATDDACLRALINVFSI